MKSVLLKNDGSLDFTGFEGDFDAAGHFLTSKCFKIENVLGDKKCVAEG